MRKFFTHILDWDDKGEQVRREPAEFDNIEDAKRHLQTYHLTDPQQAWLINSPSGNGDGVAEDIRYADGK